MGQGPGHRSYLQYPAILPQKNEIFGMILRQRPRAKELKPTLKYTEYIIICDIRLCVLWLWTSNNGSNVKRRAIMLN